MKKCSTCKETKDNSLFDTDYRTKDDLTLNCLDCLSLLRSDETKRVKSYRRSEKGQDSRKKYMWSKYGLSTEQFDTLLTIQDNSCAICGKNFDKAKIYIDHCHTTNKVRGLLCLQCNTSLGNFYDDTNLLSNAINYINKYKEDK